MSSIFPYPLPPQVYPTREARDSVNLDHKVYDFFRLKERSNRVNDRYVASLIHSIERYGILIKGIDDKEFQQQILRLKMAVHQHGFTREYVVRSFALIVEAADQILGMRPYPTQITGAWVMLNGMIAEMDTGQGKTLTASITAIAAALAGVPCHVITVNEYLAVRDAETMAPLFHHFGLRVDVIKAEMDEGEKKQAYTSDIVYCTNKQVAFDHLRDRMQMGTTQQQCQLSIERMFDRPSRLSRLMLPGLVFGIVDEADSVLADEAVTPLIISRSLTQNEHEFIYQQALTLAEEMSEEEHFSMRPQLKFLQLTSDGQEYLEWLCEDMEGLWQVSLTREMLVVQALKALHLFVCDVDYLIMDGKVNIIDQGTGRVMADRSWEQGLHQMIELKEGCELSQERETIARISYQRFFKRYIHIAGMTGTAKEIKSELNSVYGLALRRILPHQKNLRRFEKEQLFRTKDAKFDSILQRIVELNRDKKAVLVGTQTVADSEYLSQKLSARDITHQLLNARQDAQEADIVAQAGQLSQVTIATNMAGRGTDIKLSDEVKALGGLYIIVTELHDLKRVDRQLFGRCARQGDPGVVELFISLEDDFFLRHVSRPILKLLSLSLAPWLIRHVIKRIQAENERSGYKIRKRLSKSDEYLADYLAFTGRLE